jgi:predicted nucleic acid-binding protein
MLTLVDTPIWSVSLRRDAAKLSAEQVALRHDLSQLIREDRARLIGIVRQEVLSGIRDEAQFRRVRDHLRAFEDEPLARDDFEEAARASNVCRRAGVAGSAADFLLCAVAIRRKWEVLTLDDDFERYARHLPLALRSPRALKSP